VKHCYLPNDYQQEIIRSALTLKQLIFERTGALVAAPTTSLPETIGANRNWDYRFCWIRDSYFMVNALLKLSKFEETEAYISYLKRIIKGSPDYLKPLYTIDGNAVAPVENFSHLSGFANSQPVRIGNDATYHHQTDAYGEAILSIYPLFKDERVVRCDTEELWQVIESLVNLAIEKFPEKDNGIWEIGGESRHYTFSKLFCWVALDRGCDIAYSLGELKTYRRWNTKRRLMKQEILTNAWSEEIQAFSQYYGGTELDASTLLMSGLGIIDPRDPRMVSTVEQTDKQLKRQGFVYRYTHGDEFGQPDNAFLLCSFWLIDALILMGQKKRARKYFEEILQYSNHLGLFSEHLEPTTKGLTGNFPQGYTHVAIINTAMLLTQG
jgi:alpha,alpha-trehalase